MSIPKVQVAHIEFWTVLVTDEPYCKDREIGRFGTKEGAESRMRRLVDGKYAEAEAK